MKRPMDETNYSSKKRKLNSESSEILLDSMNLSDMPIEVLEEIINKLPFQDFGRVRGTCSQFRNAADNILIRKLMNNIRMFDDIPSNTQFMFSKIFYQLTWPYIKFGFRSSVAGVYLTLIQSPIFANNLATFPQFLDYYVAEFYQCIDSHLGDQLTYLSRLLYLVTILGFLNKLTNIERIEEVTRDELKFYFILNDAVFGLLWVRPHQRNTLVYAGDRNSIISFFINIMASNITEQPMHTIWDGGYDKVVVYGNKCLNGDGKIMRTCVLFEFTICGSDAMLEFLRTAPIAGEWNELPTDNFTVAINIQCTDAQKFGCPSPTNFSFEI